MTTLSRFFLLSLFLFSNFLFAKDITLKEVIDRLTYHHGPEWKSIVHSADDQRKIHQHLQTIIDKKVDYKHSDFREYHLWAPHIYETAVGELGNFTAVDSSRGRKTLEQLKKIHVAYLRKKKNQPPTPGVDSFLTSLYQSVSSIGTPEALDYLTNQLGQSEVYDYSLMEMINQNLVGTVGKKPYKTDFNPSMQFTPNIEKPYHERPGDWKRSIKKFRLKLASYRNKAGVSSSLKQFARTTNFQTASIINGAFNPKDKVVNRIQNKNASSRTPSSESFFSSPNKSSDRSPSQIEESQSKEDSGYYLQAILVILFSVAGFWFFFSRKR